MTRQQKTLLLVLGGASVVGGVSWYLYSQRTRPAVIDRTVLQEKVFQSLRTRPVELLAVQRQRDIVGPV